VVQAYSVDSKWRDRTTFLKGHQEIIAYLRKKWSTELNYKLMKELWAFDKNRISVRFEYEWRDFNHNWYRTHGNEHWEFDKDGLIKNRDMSANDIPILESQRRILGMEVK